MRRSQVPLQVLRRSDKLSAPTARGAPAASPIILSAVPVSWWRIIHIPATLRGLEHRIRREKHEVREQHNAMCSTGRLQVVFQQTGVCCHFTTDALLTAPERRHEAEKSTCPPAKELQIYSQDYTML